MKSISFTQDISEMTIRTCIDRALLKLILPPFINPSCQVPRVIRFGALKDIDFFKGVVKGIALI